MKKTTKDEYLQAVYRVIYHIEKHYGDDLSVELLSKIARFSKYHFHRVFHSIVGMSMGEYIRMVRLQESSSKLRSDVSVTEVALKSGYETHASFAKAFKVRFGLSPKEFSKKTKEQKGYIMIEPKIVDFETVEVLCVRKMGDYTVSAGEAFGALMSFAYEQKIKHKKKLLGKDSMLFGIGYDDPNTTPLDDLRYDACITHDDKTVEPKGEVVVKSIEGGKHLYYLHRGSYEGLKKVYADMIQYMIENELTIANRPPFERYLNRDPRRTKPQNLKTEIYIPIEG